MKSRSFAALLVGAFLALDTASVLADPVASGGYSIQRKRGGYSYDKSDSINTYGNNKPRRRDPGPPNFRDQTIAGPFDNSFFFDSGVGSVYGGNSPYMH